MQGSRLQDVIPSSHNTTRPLYNIPLARLKGLFCPKLSHSLIISHRTVFIILTCDIQVLYIAKNSNHPWFISHNTIPFLVRPWHINSNNPPLTTTYIMTSSDTCWRIDALSLTHTTVTANGIDLTWSNIIPSNIIRPLKTVQYHTLQYIQHFHPHNTYVHIHFIPTPSPNKWLTSIRSLLHAYYVFHISWIPNYFTLYLSHLIPRVQTVSFTEHSIIHTNALAHLFPLGLNQISASILTPGS